MKLILLLFLLTSCSVFGQDEVLYNGEKINILDQNNQKQGVWKLFDEQNNLMIICEMKDDTLDSDINYYKNSDLIISFKKSTNYFELYKGLDTLQAQLIKTPDDRTTLVKMNGEDVDVMTQKWFHDNSEIMSMYYGGLNEIGKFISQSINYSNTKHRVGKVKVKFTIDINGFPTDIEIVEGNDKKLIKEAIRIVEAMPRWQPAHQRGRFVKTSFTLPFSFK
jgi:TonB family protein